MGSSSGTHESGGGQTPTKTVGLGSGAGGSSHQVWSVMVGGGGGGQRESSTRTVTVNSGGGSHQSSGAGFSGRNNGRLGGIGGERIIESDGWSSSVTTGSGAAGSHKETEDSAGRHDVRVEHDMSENKTSVGGGEFGSSHNPGTLSENHESHVTITSEDGMLSGEGSTKTEVVDAKVVTNGDKDGNFTSSVHNSTRITVTDSDTNKTSRPIQKYWKYHKKLSSYRFKKFKNRKRPYGSTFSSEVYLNKFKKPSRYKYRYNNDLDDTDKQDDDFTDTTVDFNDSTDIFEE
ncbi:unnamed protein product [Trichobilharzia szidati]|nr:unnamed protein product [Trichobilharzia szidati]